MDDNHAHRALTTAVADAERLLLLMSAACLAVAGDIASYGYGGSLPVTGQIQLPLTWSEAVLSTPGSSEW